MGDYTLAIGDAAPYGFAAASASAAARHALDYCLTKGVAANTPMVLMGPDGLLTEADDSLEAFRDRIPRHWLEATDDVRPADPTPPDCNGA